MKYRRERKKNTQHNKEFINTKTKTKNHNQNETKRNQPSKCSILAWAHTCIHRRRNIHTAHYGTVRLSTVQHQHSTAQLCSEASLIVRQSQIYVSNTLGQREPRQKWLKRNKKVNVCLCFCIFVVVLWHTLCAALIFITLQLSRCFACIRVTMHTILCLKIHVITLFHLLIHIFIL